MHAAHGAALRRASMMRMVPRVALVFVWSAAAAAVAAFSPQGNGTKAVYKTLSWECDMSASTKVNGVKLQDVPLMPPTPCARNFPRTSLCSLMLQPPPALPNGTIPMNARLHANRHLALKAHTPQNAAIVEVGTFRGGLARYMRTPLGASKRALEYVFVVLTTRCSDLALYSPNSQTSTTNRDGFGQERHPRLQGLHAQNSHAQKRPHRPKRYPKSIFGSV